MYSSHTTCGHFQWMVLWFSHKLTREELPSQYEGKKLGIRGVVILPKSQRQWWQSWESISTLFVNSFLQALLCPVYSCFMRKKKSQGMNEFLSCKYVCAFYTNIMGEQVCVCIPYYRHSGAGKEPWAQRQAFMENTWAGPLQMFCPWILYRAKWVGLFARRS